MEKNVYRLLTNGKIRYRIYVNANNLHLHKFRGDNMKSINLIKKSKVHSGKVIVILTVLMLFSASLIGCSTNTSSKSVTDKSMVQAVGAENEYADVISQIGGKYVSVTAVMSNPSTDPHSYEANTKDETQISKATLIVQNGLGYDDFMDKLEGSSKNSSRTVINVSKALGYSDNTQNPHLWYKPDTMEIVAKLVAKNLESQLPANKKYFEDRLNKFNASLKTWKDDMNEIQKTYSKAGVAVTEPVANYLLEASGLNVETPWGFQASVMNGTDPSPQNVKTQEDLLKEKKVKVFVYNQQAIDDITTNLLKIAKDNNIPIVGVYETMPTKHTYQTWMEDETKNILKALKDKISTETMS